MRLCWSALPSSYFFVDSKKQLSAAMRRIVELCQRLNWEVNIIGIEYERILLWGYQIGTHDDKYRIFAKALTEWGLTPETREAGSQTMTAYIWMPLVAGSLCAEYRCNRLTHCLDVILAGSLLTCWLAQRRGHSSLTGIPYNLEHIDGLTYTRMYGFT